MYKMKNKMKKIYIAPETEVVNIELENMIAASLGVGGDALGGGVTDADIKAFEDWKEIEDFIGNSPLW